MDSNALEQLLSEVDGSSPMSVTVAADEGNKVVLARRVTENDWRIALEGTHSLAGRLEAVVDSAPATAQGTCKTVRRLGHDRVRLEIGCRGPHLMTSLLQVVIDHHASAHPRVHLQAMLQVDDSMRPRRIDLLLPPRESRQSDSVLGLLGLMSAQPV